MSKLENLNKVLEEDDNDRLIDRSKGVKILAAIEKIREELDDATSNEAILLAIFRDVVGKLSRGNSITSLLTELEDEFDK